jgi:hypothetical protein
MKVLDLSNDDLVIENGDFKFVQYEKEIAQSLERRLTTRLTEFFLEPEIGIDYNILYQKNPDLDDIRDAIGDCLSQDERVLSVDMVEFDLKKDRSALIRFKATSNTGPIEGEVNL